MHVPTLFLFYHEVIVSTLLGLSPNVISKLVTIMDPEINRKRIFSMLFLFLKLSLSCSPGFEPTLCAFHDKQKNFISQKGEGTHFCVCDDLQLKRL